MRVLVLLLPNASRNEIGGRTDDGYLKVRVRSLPKEGSANVSLVKLIAERVGVPVEKIRIISGEKSPKKVLDIEGDAESIKKGLEGKK